MAKGDQKRAQKRAARARRKKGQGQWSNDTVMMISENKTIVVSREGRRGWLRFNARGNV